MKRIILAVLILWGTFAGAVATFTAVASGDWQSNATWGTTAGLGCHVTYPCITDTFTAGNPTNGDTVDLATFTVTCGSSETCSAGASNSTTTSCTAGTAAVRNSSTSGGLTLTATSTFIYGGAVCLPFGTITINAGAKVYHDSSWAATPVSYKFQDNDAGSNRSTWAAGTVGGSRIVWEGDSYNSPSACRLTGQTCNTQCASANIAGCMAGTVAGAAALESGLGNFYNMTFQNVGGTGIALLSYIINILSTNYDGLIMTNSGELSVRLGGNKSVLINRSKFTSTSVTSLASGCFNPNSMVGTGTMTITNNVFECPIVAPTTVGFTGVRWRNNICSTAWASGGYYTAGSTNLRPCLNGGKDSGFYDQMYFLSDGWNTTGSENLSAKANMGVAYFTNNIVFAPRNVGTGGGHLHPFDQTWGGLTGGDWVQADNVYGSFGDTYSTAGAEAHQTGNPGGGNPGTTLTSLTVTGNVNVCGYVGRGSVTANGGFFSSATTTNVGSDVVTTTNNTYCSTAASLGAAAQGDGGQAAETATVDWVLNFVGMTGANTYFRADGIAAGAVPEIFDMTANAHYVSSPPWHNFFHNAVLNTSVPGSNPFGTNGNNGAWITAPAGGMTTTTEIMSGLDAQLFLVDPHRAPPLFSEYLNASGIFPYSNYTGAGQYKGKWTSGASYVQGDIVYVDGTITGYSTVYNGRTLYVICKVAHTAGATNSPFNGYDASNPFLGPTQVWEDAYISMWLKPAVLAATTYNQDGALLPLAANATANSSGTLYAVGLLNEWVRSGFVNKSPLLWGGAPGAAYCSTSTSGATSAECGAVPLTTIQHIRPDFASN